jgi:hypothetical protein
MRCHAWSTRNLLLLIILCISFNASTLSAEPVTIRYREGSLSGCLALRSLDGKLLASGVLSQSVHGDRVTAHLVFHFKDGSLDDEKTVFTQHGSFHVVSYRHIQKGPAFPKPTDISIDSASGQVTVRYRENDEEKTDTEHIDIPPDLSNGLILILLKNLPAATNDLKLSFIAATPKPRLVHLAISRQDPADFIFAELPHRADRFKIKIEIGGVAGAIAPIVGKQPSDIDVWILRGEVPAFVRLEGALFNEGPIWSIETAGPTSFKPASATP